MPEDTDDLLEIEEEEKPDFENKKLVAVIADIHKMLKNLSAALGEKYPTYKYPKKMQEFMEKPEEFEKFLSDVEASEKESIDFKEKIEKLETKLKDFEQVEKDKKITEYLDIQEEKGLIQSEVRENLFKNFSENFTIIQIDSLISNLTQMDFSKSKTKKGKELGERDEKDFKKEIEELEVTIKDFKASGVAGLSLKEAEEELEKLKNGSSE